MVDLYAISCFKTSHDELRCSRIELLLDLPGVPYDLALKTFSSHFPFTIASKAAVTGTDSVPEAKMRHARQVQ